MPKVQPFVPYWAPTNFSPVESHNPGHEMDLQQPDFLFANPSDEDLTQNPLFQQHPTPTFPAPGFPSSDSLDHTIDTIQNIPFRIETTYACIEPGCNKKYARKPDLIRHYRGAHLRDQRYKCRVAACERAQRGFHRRDKRDDHERKMHRRKA